MLPSLTLPPEVFQNVEGSARIAFSLYTTASLFPVREENFDQRFSIASSVLGVILHEINTAPLAQNVTLILPIKPVSVVEVGMMRGIKG